MGFSAPPLRPRLTIPAQLPPTPTQTELARRRTQPASITGYLWNLAQSVSPSSRQSNSQLSSESARTPLSALLLNPAAMPLPHIHPVLDMKSKTYSFVVADPVTEDAVVINPVLSLDTSSMVVHTQSADEVLRLVEEEGYNVTMIIETGIRKRSLSACAYLKGKLEEVGDQDVRVVVGGNVRWELNDLGREAPDKEEEEGPGCGSPFNHFFNDNEKFRVGNLVGTVVYLSSPPATPPSSSDTSSSQPQPQPTQAKDTLPGASSVAYIIGQNIFVGDFQSHCELSLHARRKLLDVRNSTPVRTATSGAGKTRIYGLGQSTSVDSQVTPTQTQNQTSTRTPTQGQQDHDEVFITLDQLREYEQEPEVESSKHELMKETPASSTSDVMAFYATSINKRGGRIPETLNLDLPLCLDSNEPDGGSKTEEVEDEEEEQEDPCEGEERVTVLEDTQIGATDGTSKLTLLLARRSTDEPETTGSKKSRPRKTKGKRKEEVKIKPLLIPRRLQWLLC